MHRSIDRETALSVFQRALASGATRKSLARVHWDTSGNCSNPQVVHLTGRPSAKEEKTVVIGRGLPSTLLIDLETRCRKCENCLAKRASHWRYRAIDEWRWWNRTWMCTLTLTPHEHFLCLSRARKSLDCQGVDLDTLSTDEEFRLRHREASRLLTLWLKRLRKGTKQNPGGPFRYLLVAEAHKSGLPHYHAMVHEIDPVRPIRHRAIKAAWVWGFSDAKLVTDRDGASYATKYLTKSALARVRASVAYGDALSVAGVADQRDPPPLENASQIGSADPRLQFIEPLLSASGETSDEIPF